MNTKEKNILMFHQNNTSIWWRHQMETFSAFLAIFAGNSPVTGEFPSQRPVTRSFDIFLDLRPNKRLSKQRWGWCFETPARPLWRHCHGLHVSPKFDAGFHDAFMLFWTQLTMHISINRDRSMTSWIWFSVRWVHRNMCVIYGTLLAICKASVYQSEASLKCRIVTYSSIWNRLVFFFFMISSVKLHRTSRLLHHT